MALLLQVHPLIRGEKLVGIKVNPLELRGDRLEFWVDEVRFPLLERLQAFLKLYSRGIWRVPVELAVAVREVASEERSWALPIYEALLNVGLGETITYGELAKMANTSPRAVGLAMRLNPFPLIIPCHRVVAKKGLGGFSLGLDLKRALLEWEERRKREKLVEERVSS